MYLINLVKNSTYRKQMENYDMYEDKYVGGALKRLEENNWTYSDKFSNKYPLCLLNDLSHMKDSCKNEASRGDLDELKHLHEKGYPWNIFTTINAATNGKLNCLKYAHEMGCPWNRDVCSSAARNCHLDCLTYAHEMGCPWTKSTCNEAAKTNSSDCLKYAIERGCPYDHDVFAYAAQYGNLEGLKYLFSLNDLEVNISILETAAFGGHYECLRFLFERFETWGKKSQVCEMAAYRGSLECLKYAIENGAPFDESTACTAAERGNLKCLKYLHLYGCEMTQDVYDAAKNNGRILCYNYAADNKIKENYFKCIDHDTGAKYTCYADMANDSVCHDIDSVDDNDDIQY